MGFDEDSLNEVVLNAQIEVISQMQHEPPETINDLIKKLQENKANNKQKILDKLRSYLPKEFIHTNFSPLYEYLNSNYKLLDDIFSIKIVDKNISKFIFNNDDFKKINDYYEKIISEKNEPKICITELRKGTLLHAVLPTNENHSGIASRLYYKVCQLNEESYVLVTGVCPEHADSKHQYKGIEKNVSKNIDDFKEQISICR